MLKSELLNLLNNKNNDETSVVPKGPLPRSILSRCVTAKHAHLALRSHQGNRAQAASGAQLLA